MMNPDLNLLIALDILLSECSVAGAAKRLRLSPSAMSRTLARLREATGDPLLVRAGRGLVPTPRALELREQAGPLSQAALTVLRPAETLDLARLTRGFTLRNREGFVENFGPALIARLRQEAPQVRLHFIGKPDRDSAPLRSGEVDLETGVVGEATGPELRALLLLRDRFVGVVRRGHALSEGEITPARYAAGEHVIVSRRGLDRDRIDEALERIGCVRQVAVSVASFSEALALASETDLIASVPEGQTGRLRAGLHTFALPFPAPDIPISLLWHPRMDADPAHRWLRGCVREVCRASPASASSP